MGKMFFFSFYIYVEFFFDMNRKYVGLIHFILYQSFSDIFR